MKTGIIILNYNDASGTIACIDSLLKYNTAGIKIVVVDNASTDKKGVVKIDNWLRNKFRTDYSRILDREEREEAELSKVSFVLSEANNGYASGNNIGLKYCYADSDIEYIMILNSDILFIEDIIPGLISDLINLEDAAIVSPLLWKKGRKEIDFNCARRDVNIVDLALSYLVLKKNLFPSWKKKEEQHYFKTNPCLLQKDIVDIELPSGSCMFLRKDLFKKIDGFDPDTFLYYEENILYRKVLAQGKRVYLNTQRNCIHLGASTISNHWRDYEFDKKCDRSAYIYVNRYSSASLIIKLFFNLMFHFYSLNRFLIHTIKERFLKERSFKMQ
nr:glycosyltransferase [uncultured Draconibacterium sp.]